MCFFPPTRSLSQYADAAMKGGAIRGWTFLVKTQIRGESEIRAGANVIRMIAGDFVVCNLSRPFSLSFDCDTEIVSIPIPVRFLERFMPYPDAIAFRSSDRSKATHGVVSDFLESLLRVRTLAASPQQVARLRDTYFELLALAFEQPDTASQLSSARSFHFARIKEQIDLRLEDEMFCLDELAQSLGMSKRYLHSVFSASGTSVSSYIMSARLARAARLLRCELGRRLTIAEIANQSVAHFTRSFKAHYGETPVVYRNGGPFGDRLKPV